MIHDLFVDIIIIVVSGLFGVPYTLYYDPRYPRRY